MKYQEKNLRGKKKKSWYRATARAQQGRRSAVGSDRYHTHAHVQNLRIDRPLTRYPERGYDLMSTGGSGNGMLRQRTVPPTVRRGQLRKVSCLFSSGAASSARLYHHMTRLGPDAERAMLCCCRVKGSSPRVTPADVTTPGMRAA